jgi:hypothetical protein
MSTTLLSVQARIIELEDEALEHVRNLPNLPLTEANRRFYAFEDRYLDLCEEIDEMR